MAAARKELAGTCRRSEIPTDVAKAWREAGARGGKAAPNGSQRLEASGKAQELRDRWPGGSMTAG